MYIIFCIGYFINQCAQKEVYTLFSFMRVKTTWLCAFGEYTTIRIIILYVLRNNDISSTMLHYYNVKFMV